MMRQDQYTQWRIADLGRVITGRTPPTEVTDYFGDEYPFVTPSDMEGQKTINSTERLLSSSGAALLKNNRVPGGSIAVSCIGWQMGKVAVIGKEAFTNQQINTIVPNGCAIPDYLYYALCTRREELKNLGSVGTRTPILNKSRFESLVVTLPPVPIQRKIAAILSAYDDLIENNTRRIALLEAMAQALYREWFVRFRFPGHQSVPLVDSPLGPIPQGWRVGTLQDALLLQRGFDLPTSSRREGDVPVYSAGGKHGWHDQAQVKGPGVVTARAGSIGTVTYVYEDFWPLNTTLWVKEFRCKSSIYAYYLLSGLDFSSINSGLAVPMLNRNYAYQLPITLPPQELVERFDGHVSPLYAMKRSLERMSTNLRQMRDLLLPKLVSGEVDVSEMEIVGE